jgi:glycosyltransferase involved in cell wall biosynthesis
VNSLISIVVPLKNEPNEIILKLLESIKRQSFKPDEVVIVDSSSSDRSHEEIFQSTDLKINYYHKKNLFPGAARNFGANKTNNNLIAFLDSSTRPDPEWLEYSKTMLHAELTGLVIGKTKFKAKTHFQKILRACSYGKVDSETVPGTLIKKTIFTKNQFIETVRAGEDQEWKKRISLENMISVPSVAHISYFGFPQDIYRTIKKYYTYSVASAFIEVQNNLKDLYLSLLLILTALIIPRWNYLLSDWDNSPWYIDDISKKYLILICLIFFLVSFFNRFINHNFRFGLLSRSVMKFIIFIGVSLLIYNWNRLFSVWVESALLYIPHITKIYILLLIAISFFIRGIYFPMKRKVESQFLFPLNWIIVGFVGLILDLIKLPGYSYGALRSLTNRNKL